MIRRDRVRRPRRKVCQCCVDHVDTIDYKNIAALRRFVSERGKILPRRVTGTCAKHQRKINLAIKRARAIALLPFSADWSKAEDSKTSVLGFFYWNWRNGEATAHKNPKVLRVFAQSVSSFPLTGKADCQVRCLLCWTRSCHWQTPFLRVHCNYINKSAKKLTFPLRDGELFALVGCIRNAGETLILWLDRCFLRS